ncbi:MAG: DUF7005 family protein [Betaproteobacteria bacterium]
MSGTPVDDRRRTERAGLLQECGATDATLDELLAYNDKPVPADVPRPVFPLADEPHLDAWLGYEREARDRGTFAALREHFVQLQFPVRAGISGEEAYRRATRRGDVAAAAEYADSALSLVRPDSVDLRIVATIAGRVPVIVAGERDDFVTLVRAFSERNEPAPVPDAMGACIVTGLNNWSRIRAYRARWEEEQGEAATEEAWAGEFQRLIPHKPLYQDRFIILSRGPYSAIAAADAGLSGAEWLERSLAIRREHELTHYFTQRVFGVMRKNAFDELIADFVGLVRAFGEYRADLALRFVGLEAFPRFRPGGRLEVYRGNPPLSDAAFAVVQTLFARSARNLQTFSEANRPLLTDLAALANLTFSLTTLTLEELASPGMPKLVAAQLS